MEKNETKKMPNWVKWIIVLVVVLLFALTTPRKTEDFINPNNPDIEYFTTRYFVLFSVCRCTGCGTANYVTYVGILGNTFRVAEGSSPIIKK